MKKMEYTTARNMLAKTPENAYVGIFLHNGSETLDTLANAIAKGSVLGRKRDAKAAIRSAAEEIKRLVGEELYRVRIGNITFEPAISGSVAAMDASLTSENRLFVRVRGTGTLAKKLYGETLACKVDGDALQNAPVIDKVEDLATSREGIVGGGVFVVTGSNLYAARSGEAVELVDAEGNAVASAIVDETPGANGSGERIYAYFEELPSAGDYVLRVTSFGSGDELRVAQKRVKVYFQ